MPITRMNHAVLYVRDARRSQRFYHDILGFLTVIDDPAGGFVFMRAPASSNHHDIAFFSIGYGASNSEAGRRTVGMYHVAWEVPTLEELAGDAGPPRRGRRPRRGQRPRRQQEPLRRVTPTGSSSR